jgi:hypothetical protein
MRIPSLTVALALLVAACGGQTTPVDASVLPDAARDAAGDGGASCQYGPPPGFEALRSCSAATDCDTVYIPKDCCGDVVYGVRSEHVRPVSGDVTARIAGCPQCGCAAQPVDEFGQRGTSFSAACEGGKCVAHAK